MKQSETIANLAAALSKAQGEMPAAPKDAENTHLRNTYATLGSIIATATPVLSRHGLSFAQMPSEAQPGYMALTTRIMHDSGEWIEGTMVAAVPQSKLSEIQAAGSVISYMRRYSLSSALGMMTDDDDGHAASAPARAPQKAQQAPARPQSPAPAPTAPAGTLSAAQAKKLHERLGAILQDTLHREKKHTTFAAEVLGRDVGSLTDLTVEEARTVQITAESERDAA